MSKQKVADFLFERIKENNVECTFGIPGDFVLPVYAAQVKAGLKTVVMCHEPAVGFAADAYARIRGLGVALVTYGAGGLNMVNATALAYAEESPLLVVSGSPETRFRGGKPQLHHCVKTFDTQYKVYAEVTETQALIDDPHTAQKSIEGVLNSIRKTSRPGYIEMPRDNVNAEFTVQERPPDSVKGESASLQEAIGETLDSLKAAKQAVLFAGAHLKRFGLMKEVVLIADALNIPVVTSILGKASFPESHPNFIGTYFGKFGEPNVREFVESSDCILCLGALLTEMETGGYSANLPPEKLILANAQELNVGFHNYKHANLRAFVEQLSASITSGGMGGKKFSIPKLDTAPFDHSPQASELSVGAMIDQLNKFADENYAIVSDVGDCLYAGLSIKTDEFIAAGYYSSMGFGVPAGIGAQLARPKVRSIVLVGDGGFQMTGNELSAAVRSGINPIVIVFNNSSYAMLRFIDQKRDYYDLSPWDFCAYATALGAKAMRAKTKQEFAQALKVAEGSETPFLIDAVIAETDISPTLKRLTDHFGQKMRAAF
jgi:indolepyruvate decarboxylase